MRRIPLLVLFIATIATAIGCGGSSSVQTRSGESGTDGGLDAPPDSPDAATCPSSQSLCGGACTDTNVDGNNCGACGHVCPAGTVCSAGTCATTCGNGLTECSADAATAYCANLQTDNVNCGTCGNSCPAGTVCSAGACATSCGGGLTKCSTNAGVAYCANLQTDNVNCGACGTTCPDGQVCSASACATSCATPLVKCGSSCVDTQNDPANCGGCGTTCGPYTNATAACVNGACHEICDAGYLDCSGTGTGGCDVDPSSDPDHCGGCSVTSGPYANATASCTAGKCDYSCDSAHLDCNGFADDGCEVDPMTDHQNCGACKTACAAACASGVCVNVTGIAAGHEHTCAALSDGTVECWGNNTYLQLGGSGPQTQPLRPVPGVSGVVSVTPGRNNITAGGDYTCVLLSQGSVECWGADGAGQLGNGVATFRAPPNAVTGLSTVVSIAAGEYHTCALIWDGSVKCWGSNARGQLGDGTTNTRLAPILVPGLSDVAAIGAGGNHTCAVMWDGTLECWGDNTYGELGDGTTTDHLSPEPVPGLSNIAAVTGGDDHTCALTSNHTVLCWGRNLNGQIGDGTSTERHVPTPVLGLSNVTAVVAGSRHTCALHDGGFVDCWGFGAYGQLGAGSGAIDSVAPQPVWDLTTAKSLTAGSMYSCGVVSSGTVKCWGSNSGGQIGDGTLTTRYAPTPVTWP